MAVSSMQENVRLPLRLCLYETSYCHLCEEAQQHLAPYVEQGVCEIELIDIAVEDGLLERYGQRIPVLRDAVAGTELDWPFTPEKLDAWLRYQAGV